MPNPHRPTLLAACALAAAFALAGCERHDDSRSAGQKLDAAIAQTERKADELHADASRTLDRAGERLARGGAEARNKVDDAAITTAVNAELARDPALSALAIDVDTANARVALRGSAPDEAARQRATRLAAGVKGVEAVDNQLMVKNP